MPETNDRFDAVSEVPTAREKFEQEKLSRRAALRKIGITSGMALFGMFAVDDLARVALRQLEQHKETQAVAETVAKELKNSGIAFADGGDDGGYYDAGPCTLTPDNADSCKDGRLIKHKGDLCLACLSDYTNALKEPTGFQTCYEQQITAGKATKMPLTIAT